MNTVYFLIPISMILLIISIVCFFWSIKTKQFEDLEKPAYDIIFNQKNESNSTKKNLSIKYNYTDAPKRPVGIKKK
jgi:cbb3-type cytochrome oxidase maturation protein